MSTRNTLWFRCRPDRAYRLASQVERWPELLPHYRWVRFHEGGPGSGVVEMAARREFGRLQWPVWWLSRMAADPEAQTVRYTHVAGVTRGMEVLWSITPAYTGSRVTITHQWSGGPRFCGPAARSVGRAIVGPLFVHYIAQQTLNHLALHARKEELEWTGVGR